MAGKTKDLKKQTTTKTPEFNKVAGYKNQMHRDFMPFLHTNNELSEMEIKKLTNTMPEKE